MTKKNDQASKEELDAAAGLAGTGGNDTVTITVGEGASAHLFEGQGEQIERDNNLFNRLPGADSLGAVSFEPTHAEKTASLIARIDAHEAEGAAIEAVMTELGHDAKSIRTIKRARAKAEAAKRTYDALFGAGLVEKGRI